jgi:Rrf2 family protein
LDQLGPINPEPMNITRAADYAVRVMVHLAGLPTGSCVARPDLTRATATPDSFLAKVLQQLVQVGMITSRRGSGGGFRLAVSPESVSLLDVIEAIEGPTQLNTCLEPGPSCERKSWCAAHAVWVEAQSALQSVLRSASIAELAARSCKTLNSEQEMSPMCGVAVTALEPANATEHK